jgi:cell division transport system permease protein
LNAAIAAFAELYGSQFQLQALAPLSMVALLALSASLGLIGALLSVQRHLARMN